LQQKATEFSDFPAYVSNWRPYNPVEYIEEDPPTPDDVNLTGKSNRDFHDPYILVSAIEASADNITSETVQSKGVLRAHFQNAVISHQLFTSDLDLLKDPKFPNNLLQKRLLKK